MAHGSGEPTGKRKRGRTSDRRRPVRRDDPARAAAPSFSFRERLKRDRFLFALSLSFLAFTTWALAITWKLVGDPLLLVLTILSVVPAFYLFYLRDSPTG